MGLLRWIQVRRGGPPLKKRHQEGGSRGKQGLLPAAFTVWLGQLSYRLCGGRLEQQLAQTGETLFTLEFQREAVENAPGQKCFAPWNLLSMA